MEKRLRALALGFLGGMGAAALLLGVVALLGGLAAAADVVAFNSVLPPARMAAIVAAGALTGAIAGGIASRVRSLGGAALLGAAAAIAASGVIRALDPGAYGWDVTPTGLGERIALLLLPGVVGLSAPAIWAPVRAAAARTIWRAAAEIAGRVAAFVLGLFAALLCAPLMLAAAYGLIGGVLMLPRVDVLLMGVGYAVAVLALGGTSVLCLRLAGVPRGRERLPGFERPPPVEGDQPNDG